MLLSNAQLYPTIPVTDLARARIFYEDTLGLKISDDTMPQGLVFQIGPCKLYIYQRDPSKADHTLAGFQVDDIVKTIEELTEKGVMFEHYDFPGLKTDEKGISIQGPVKAAWFKDPDGNILGITEIS